MKNFKYTFPMLVYSGAVLLAMSILALWSGITLIVEPFGFIMGPIFVIVGCIFIVFTTPVVVLSALFLKHKYQKKSFLLAIIVLSSVSALVVTLVFAIINLTILSKKSKNEEKNHE